MVKEHLPELNVPQRSRFEAVRHWQRPRNTRSNGLRVPQSPSN
jgi:hypothetical protein